MTQTAIPPTGAPCPHDPATFGRGPAHAARPVLSLHGSDPATGIPMTWHVTSLADDGAGDAYLIEHAEGDIHSPALWMQAHRGASVVGEAEVLALVRSVMFGSAAPSAD